MKELIPLKYRKFLRKTLSQIQAWFFQAKNLFGRYICPVCGKRVHQFIPLNAEKYIQMPLRLGRPWKPEDAETCNVFAYTCPLCHANDRDRLYALYLSRYFEQMHGCQVALLDIAASQPTTRIFCRVLEGMYQNLFGRSWAAIRAAPATNDVNKP